MGKPVAIRIPGATAVSYPDVCETILPLVGKVPLPFTNVAQIKPDTKASDKTGKELLVGGFHVLLQDAEIEDSSGDEVGFLGGVVSGVTQGSCKIVQASTTVLYNGEGIVRFMDATLQNIKDKQTPNATGNVMSSFPTVLVGG